MANSYRNDFLKQKIDLLAEREIAEKTEDSWWLLRSDHKWKISQSLNKIESRIRNNQRNGLSPSSGDLKKLGMLEDELTEFNEKCEEFEKRTIEPIQKNLSERLGLDKYQTTPKLLTQEEIAEIEQVFATKTAIIGLSRNSLVYQNADKHLEDLRSQDKDSLRNLFHMIGNCFYHIKGVITHRE